MKTLAIKETAPGKWELLTPDGKHVTCLNGPLSTIEDTYSNPEWGKDAHLVFPSAAGAAAHAEYFHYQVEEVR